MNYEPSVKSDMLTGGLSTIFSVVVETTESVDTVTFATVDNVAISSGVGVDVDINIDTDIDVGINVDVDVEVDIDIDVDVEGDVAVGFDVDVDVDITIDVPSVKFENWLVNIAAVAAAEEMVEAVGEGVVKTLSFTVVFVASDDVGGKLGRSTQPSGVVIGTQSSAAKTFFFNNLVYKQ